MLLPLCRTKTSPSISSVMVCSQPLTSFLLGSRINSTLLSCFSGLSDQADAGLRGDAPGSPTGWHGVDELLQPLLSHESTSCSIQ